MLYPDGIVRRHSGTLGAALRDRMVTGMDRETRFETIRRAYATQTMAAAGVVDRRIEAAFAAVKREDFLGPGPWQILRWDRGYEKAPSADPVYLYDDVVVAIVPERNLNNGQPSFLAALIAGSAPRPGEHAVHIGVGVTRRSWRGWSAAPAGSPRSSSIRYWPRGPERIWPHSGISALFTATARGSGSSPPT